jgi:Methyltransferase FkbM domain
MRFMSADGYGGIHTVMSPAVKKLVSTLQAFQSFNDVLCIPLMDLLNAIGVKHVDFLSLDVHGAEFPILKTIDFKQISIDLIVVEIYHGDSNKREKLFNNFIEFYKSTGIYREVWRSETDLMVQRITS